MSILWDITIHFAIIQNGPFWTDWRRKMKTHNVESFMYVRQSFWPNLRSPPGREGARAPKRPPKWNFWTLNIECWNSKCRKLFVRHMFLTKFGGPRGVETQKKALHNATFDRKLKLTMLESAQETINLTKFVAFREEEPPKCNFVFQCRL